MASAPERVDLTGDRSGPLDPATVGEPRRGIAVLDGALKTALGAQIPVRVRLRDGKPQLKLRLGRNPPAGTHMAEVRLGDRTIPVSIEIPTKHRLRIDPPSLRFVGGPGEAAMTDFAVENRGNAPSDLPSHAVAGAFASDGVATAFASSYELDTDDPQDMFHNFILRLRDSYAGLIRMRFKGTETPLAVGERRTVSASINIPTADSVKGKLRLGKGREFHMTFRFADLRVTSRITIG
jgi:hypothetical protein